MCLFKRIILAVFIVFFMMACESSHPTIPVTKPKPIVPVEQALEKGQFKVDIDASIVIFRVIKDGDVPVKGTLNLASGELDIKNQSTLLNLSIDMTSVDTGLSLRDSNIMSAFFMTNVTQNKTSTFKVAPLPQKQIDDFVKYQRSDRLKITGDYSFFGKTIPVTTEVQAEFNENRRLVVKTLKPFEVKISDLGLSANLQKLMTLCNHKSVDDVVQIEILLELEPI